MMPKAEWACIFNPKAGAETRFNLEALLRSMLDPHLHWVETKGPKHATQLARELAVSGIHKIIAAGGDGTINEVGQGLMGTSAAMGLLPLGSGNGLLRHLKIPLKLENAIRFLKESNANPVDVGLLNNNPFFCTSGLGLDAQVAKAFDRDPNRGFYAYLKVTWNEWYRRKAFTLKNEASVWQDVLMVTFANASQFGNNARIAPAAQVNDGQIEVVISKNPTAFNIPLIAWSLFAGDYKTLPFVDSFSSEGGQFQTEIPRLFHCDGEYFEPTDFFELKVLPGAVRVFC